MEYGIDKEAFFNLIETESQWNKYPEGDAGCSFGITHINICYHTDITEEQARNVDFSLRWTAQKFKEGKEWLWTSCSCVQSTRLKMGSALPRGDAKDLPPNYFSPIENAAILFKNHVAFIEKIEYRNDGTYLSIFQGNSYDAPCKITRKVIRLEDRTDVRGYIVKG